MREGLVVDLDYFLICLCLPFLCHAILIFAYILTRSLLIQLHSLNIVVPLSLVYSPLFQSHVFEFWFV